MKLFDGYEAVKFPQENLIFITHDTFLYYIYNPKYRQWKKHKRAGWDTITVRNYPDVRKGELTAAVGGKLPEKAADLLRLLDTSDLSIHDMTVLLNEDYPEYMHDYLVNRPITKLLQKSDCPDQAYMEVRKQLDEAQALKQRNVQIAARIKDLSMKFSGRDIFSKEIGIVDGHDSSSYFWIMPVRVLDYTNTNSEENVAEMGSNQISIEEDDVFRYLSPFLCKYFDPKLDANQRRIEYFGSDNEGTVSVEEFEWNLTHNFFSYESIVCILKDIDDTINDLASGRENEFIAQIRKNRGFITYETVAFDEPTAEGYTCKLQETEVTADLIIDFYQRFTYRMEYMMKVGKEKGYDLISFMGP